MAIGTQLPPKRLEDDGNRYIFPVGSAAPGSNFSPSVPDVQSSESLATNVVNPEIPVQPKPVEESYQRSSAMAQAMEPKSVQVPQYASADQGFDKIAGEMDKYQQMLEKDFQRTKEEGKSRLDKAQEELDKINQNPIALDNRSMWDKSSTGQKIALMIGGLLSSLDSNSAKSFQDGVKGLIERDLAEQNKKINDQREDKKMLLTRIKDITGDLDSANALYKSHAYQVIGNKLTLQAQKSQSQLQRQQAQFNAGLAYEQANLEKEKAYATIALAKNKTSVPGYEGTGVGDEVSTRALRNMVGDKPVVQANINKLLEINKKFLGGSLSPSARSEAGTAQNLLIGKLREALVGPGTMSEGDRELIKSAIANPTDIFSLSSSNKIKLQNLMDAYNRSIDSHATALGYTKKGTPSTFKGE